MAGQPQPAQPPAPQQAPGRTSLEPADQFAAAGFEGPSLAMDQEDLDAKVTVNVETVFREIMLVKVFGTLFMVLAGVLAFLPAILGGGDFVLALPAIVLGVVGMLMGMIGFFVRSMRKWMLYLAPAILIAAVAVRPLTSQVGSLSLSELVLGLAFAVFWFLGLEYLHALIRFVEVGEMAIKRKLTNFNLSGVVKHFLLYGFTTVGLIILVTLGVLGLVALMKSATLTLLAFGVLLVALGVVGSLLIMMSKDYMKGALYLVVVMVAGIAIVALSFMTEDSELFARSAELNSVYGIAVASAVTFTVVGLVLTAYYTIAATVAKVEKVEYSREKMKEMLASGQVLDFEQQPALGGGSPPS